MCDLLAPAGINPVHSAAHPPENAPYTTLKANNPANVYARTPQRTKAESAVVKRVKKATAQGLKRSDRKPVETRPRAAPAG